MSAKQTAKQATLLKSTFRELVKSVNTSVPGHVMAFDPATQLAQVQIGIQRVDLNGSVSALPVLAEVTVLFLGGDYCVEHQVMPGDEGLLHFSQRCIDGWKQSGGVAPNPIGRFHSMQDAFFVPGYRPLPDALPSFQNNGVRLRNRAGNQFVWLKNDNTIEMANGAGSFKMLADGSFLINGLTITPDGNLITALGVNVNLHGHFALDNTTPLAGKPIV